MKKQLMLACAVSAIATGALAEEQSDFEVFAGAVFQHWDEDRSLDDSLGLELGGELPVTENLSFDAWLSKNDPDIENSSLDLEGTRYSLGGLYHFSQDDLRPFMSFGGAHQEFDDSANNTHNEGLVYVGAGLKKYFDNNLVLRGELQAGRSLDHEVTDLGLRLAVGYAFGRVQSKPVEEVVMSEPVKQAVEVVEEQKSEAVAAVEEVKEVAKETVVAAVEPPADTDKDGVIDSLDKCEGTNQAFKVDASGCPVMLSETVSIQMNVQFASNSAVVPEASYGEVKKVADFMKQFDKTNVTVEGHSDDRGRDAYNKSLSQKRADSVKNVLVQKYGVNASRVQAIGYGEERPIADNATAAGRAENRRVVAVVESSIEKPAQK